MAHHSAQAGAGPLRDRLSEGFAARFGTAPVAVVRAPGRVNLIGEHTDYNEGFVLPLAIDREVLIAARPRDDGVVRLVALDQGGEECAFSLDAFAPDPARNWSNYVRGVAFLLRQRGLALTGMDAVIAGDVPIGSGLSSSAALLVAAAVTFQVLSRFPFDRADLARLTQKAENEFCGVKSGIMDQFISALAQAGQALLIDCRDLSYRHVPLPRESALVVADTRTSRALAGSAYNTRRAECEAATHALAVELNRPVHSLRDVTSGELARVEARLPSVLAKRARHVVEENARVLAAVEAAARDDLEALGQRMNESHASLRDLYEVSSPELDTMVDLARAQPGVLGARLTGAGFGGCTVNLVRAEVAPAMAPALAQAYQARTGVMPQVYLVRASAGASLVFASPPDH